MEEKRVICLFSDVEGTINHMNYESAQKLKKLLERKRKYYNADQVIISLVSNCMPEILREYINEFAAPLVDGETIILGKCFAYESVIENGEEITSNKTSKAEKIYHYLNDLELDEKYTMYAMYADDEMQNDHIETLVEASKWMIEDKIDFFIPGTKKLGSHYYIDSKAGKITDNIYESTKNNISGLIECLQKSCNNDSDSFDVESQYIK